MKTWDQPRFSPYFTQWKPGKPGFVPGTNPRSSLGQTWGQRAAQKVYVKKAYLPFSLANFLGGSFPESNLSEEDEVDMLGSGAPPKDSEGA